MSNEIQNEIQTSSVSSSSDCRKNLIINGRFDIWQRGNEFPAALSEYTADRFMIQCDNESMSVSLDVVMSKARLPGGASGGVAGIDCGAMMLKPHDIDDLTLASGFGTVQYTLEGYDVRWLVGRHATLSFWIRSNVQGTYSVCFRNPESERTMVMEYQVQSSEVWERVSLTVPFDSSSGDWRDDRSASLIIIWSFGCSNERKASSTGSWLGRVGGYLGSAGQTSLFDSKTNTVLISGVELVVGENPSASYPRNFAEELALCQRYYEKSYDLNVPPRTPSGEGCSILDVQGGSGNTPVSSQSTFLYRKRAVPIIRPFAHLTGQQNMATVQNGSASDPEEVSVLISEAAESGFVYSYSPAVQPEASYRWHWTADSEL